MRRPEQNPVVQRKVAMYFMEGRNATIGMLVMPTRNGETVWFTGEAKREPRDPADNQIGRDLAMSRALEQASHFFAHRAGRAIKENSPVPPATHARANEEVLRRAHNALTHFSQPRMDAPAKKE